VRIKGGKLHITKPYLRRAGKHKLLSREEEAVLSARILKGDEAAWEELVRCNLRLVISIARRYFGQGLEFEDLVQEGNLGLMRAARSFDTAFGTKFSTYATWWIKQSISQAISNKASLIRIPVHAAEKERIVNGARSQYQTRIGREPSIEELSEFTGKSVQEVRSALSVRKKVVSYDMLIGSDEEGSLSDLLAEETEVYIENVLLDHALKDFVEGILTELPERHRYVLKRRYGLEGDRCATLKEISHELGITGERVRQIHNAALGKLRPHVLEVNLESFFQGGTPSSGCS
jgi:RNA polymerase primary sigma factor